jgi:F-type H+-transporting ATPase subunit delta
MAADAYAKNLATALFQEALKRHDLVKWLGEIRKVSDLATDASVAAVLADPRRSLEEKNKLLKDRAGGLDPQILNLVGMLMDKSKLKELDAVSVEYQRLVDSQYGIEGAETVEITTAIPLDEDEKLKLGKRLGEMLGKPVTLRVSVDPALLGGLIIRAGDKLIDGSVRHRLQALSKELI